PKEETTANNIKEEITEPEVVEVVKEPTTEKPATEEVVEKVTEKKVWTMEELSSVLPHGTEAVENNNDSLVLKYGNKFYYQNALRNSNSIISQIQDFIKENKEIIFAFSEQLEASHKEEQKVKQTEEIKKEEEKIRQEQQARNQALTSSPLVNLNEEQKNLVGDLLWAFGGKEV
ncbi:MAG: hypothetical protein HUK24_02825, partial [Sphaerochaetaceae bacterium]|nr:hypothetical protein [Sphaerochaetaceae bacterium]